MLLPQDELFEVCLRWTVSQGDASSSSLQRKFKIGYTRAAKLIDMFEQLGAIGPMDGVKHRKILVSPAQVQALFNQLASRQKLDKQLWSAMRDDNSGLVASLLASGANANSQISGGTSALQTAAFRGQTAIISELLKYGADPNLQDQRGKGALVSAIVEEHTTALRMLIDAGANVNRPDSDESKGTPLHWAASNGLTQCAEILLDRGAHVDSEDTKRDTPLIHATWQGHIDCVTLLFANGADINHKNISGKRALHFAVKEHQTRITDFLLGNGANPDAYDIHNSTPLHCAALFDANEGAKSLINANASLNCKDDKGVTPLMYAAMRDNTAMSELLATSGADPNCQDVKGFTALHYTESIKIAETLLSSGANPAIRSINGDTPLDTIANSDIRALIVRHAPIATVIPNIALPTPAIAVQVAQQTAQTDVFAELSNLIGLSSVKHDVERMVNYLKIQQERKKRGLATSAQSLHMVFTGNPGTGKTTIARLVARIYKEMGILTTGELIEVDRSGLIGGFLGQTALKVQEVVKRAIGGVLFIDEAYSLAGSKDDRDMYGREAIDTLIKLMEDHREELVVIVAGYTEPMNAFLTSNPGLQSRFNKFVNFEDYCPDELVSIFCALASKQDYVVAEDTRLKLLTLFESHYIKRDASFGNGRLARNLFENAIGEQANRLATLDAYTDEALMTLSPEDIAANEV